MKTLPKILYFVCFVGLAMAAALALNRIVQPSISPLLLRVVLTAAVAGAPGLVYRKAWPAAIVLLPLGFYLLLRTTMPVPDLVHGIGGQYHFYVETLHKGATAYVEQFFPLTLTEAPELRLLVAVCVYCLMGAAAFMALSLRKAVPAVALILVLIGFSLTVDSAGHVLWLALTFLVLGACLLVFSRALKRDSWRLRDAVAGGVVGVIAAFLALGLIGAAPAAVATPWQDWRAWDPFRQVSSTYSFNWLQNYPSLLNPGRNMAIMKVQSPAPSYWRANALDTFTGTAWVTSQTFPTRLQAVPSGGSYSYSVAESDPTPPGKTVTEVFQAQSVYTNYFFVGGDPRSLTVDQRLTIHVNDMRSLHVSRALGPTLQYTVTAVIPDLKPSDLVGRGDDYPEDVRRYLALPFDRVDQITGDDKEASWRSMMADSGPDLREWEDLYALNEKIVGDAADPYEVTLRVEQYLRTPTNFDYSLTPPPSNYASPYAAFLFDTHTGFCQHFSGAMALLLRYNGIPARVAVGFTTGEADGPGKYVVSTNNAHAWVEVYFPKVGWVAFDPTPGRNIPAAGTPWSSSSPGFINPFVQSGTSQSTTVSTDATRDPLRQGTVDAGQTGKPSTGNWLEGAWWLPWLVGIVIAFAAWPFGRAYWRSRRLRRGSLEQRLQASFRLLRTQLLDYGVAGAPSQTLEEMLDGVRNQVHAEPDPSLIDRADAVFFGGRPALQKDIDRAEALRREVKTRLRKRYGWVRTGFTWYGVPRLRFTRGANA